MFLIEKTSLTVQAQGMVDGFQLQNDLTRWFYNELMQDIEKIFKHYNQTDKVVKIPVIIINIDLNSFDHLLENAKKEIIDQIEEKLKSISTSTQTIKQKVLEIDEKIMYENIEKAYFGIWLHFIENGHLPSTALHVDEAKMLKAVAETLSIDESAERKLMEVIFNKFSALRRLILQYDEIFLSSVLGIFLRRDLKEIVDGRMIMENIFTNLDASQWTQKTDRIFIKNLSSSYAKLHFWTFVFEHVSNQISFKNQHIEPLDIILQMIVFEAKAMTQNGNVTANKFSLDIFCQQLLDKQIFRSYASKNKAIEKSLKKFLKENEKSKDLNIDFKANILEQKKINALENNQVFYIKNAGVILCHAFLPSFFDNLGLIDVNKSFKDEASQHKAIQMIEHLATGDTSLPEYRLLLGKILCGLPIDIPLQRDISIHENDQKETINLLEAILQHWTILGTTNVEALRHGFFARDGKLSHDDKGWLLQVEQRTEDILLSRLPWGIGMIKLPFMKEILTVEWT